MARLVKKFEETGSVHDKPKATKHFSRAAIDKVEGEVNRQKALNENGISSCNSVAKSLDMPLSSVHKILRLHLKLKPYKLMHLHALEDGDPTQRLIFAESFIKSCEDDINYLRNIMWTDEANFYLHGQVATRNCVLWEASNPHQFVTQPLHSPKVTAWIGFSSQFIMKPYFFSGTVDGESYLKMLKDHMEPQLPRQRR